ncbi:hypothetical protein [Spiroplasma endosymbiont of Panorpa germanica]|uniref:hypothetical protein n=1 Tax=Spiroplasma endosymbiont of Panorpa germanica TaxID=3066314 RepID=UPI0030CDA614
MQIFYQKLCNPILLLLTFEIVSLFIIISINTSRTIKSNEYFKKHLSKFNLELKFVGGFNLFSHLFLFLILLNTILFAETLLFLLFLYYESSVDPKKWIILIFWVALYISVIKIYLNLDEIFITEDRKKILISSINYLNNFQYHFCFNNNYESIKAVKNKSKISKKLLKYINDLNDCINQDDKNKSENCLQCEKYYDDFIKFLLWKQKDLIKIEYFFNVKNEKQINHFFESEKISNIKESILEATIERWYSKK